VLSDTSRVKLRVIPLGGVGEFGSNMMLYELDDSAIIVDCGMMFPDPSTLGVDIVIPDFSYVASIRDKVHGVFLTHAHEDHIGAVPFLCDVVEAPVWGPRLALEFLRNKFREIQPGIAVDLRELTPRNPVTAGEFRVEPIHVTHSIVESLAFAIETPAGVVLHTGDFKFDQTPTDDRPSDFARISEYGRSGIRLLVSDSTNALYPGVSGSELLVRETLEHLFDRAPGRIFLTTFASHVHRIQSVVAAALALGRHVFFIGRSLVENVATAERLGHLHIPREARPPMKEIAPDDSKAVIVCTGSQGEPASALARIAREEHRQVTIQRGDTVIISARTIPGNERAIMHVIDHLLRRGSEVVYEREGVHVSGHGHQEELKLMLRMTDPELFIPIHGSLLNLVRHGQLAETTGVPPKNVFVVTNGEVVEIDQDGAGIADERVPSGKIFVDQEFEEVPMVVLRDRRHLGEDGFVIVVAAINAGTGALEREVEIITRGVIHVDESPRILDEVRELLETTLRGGSAEDLRDVERVQELLRTTLKRFFRKRLGRRPMILPVVWKM
jgi:ribonuclease J